MPRGPAAPPEAWLGQQTLSCTGGKVADVGDSQHHPLSAGHHSHHPPASHPRAAGLLRGRWHREAPAQGTVLGAGSPKPGPLTSAASSCPVRSAVSCVVASLSVGAFVWDTESSRSTGTVWWPHHMPVSLSCSPRPTPRCVGGTGGALPPAQAHHKPLPPLPSPRSTSRPCQPPPIACSQARSSLYTYDQPPPHHCALAPLALEFLSAAPPWLAGTIEDSWLYVIF